MQKIKSLLKRFYPHNKWVVVMGIAIALVIVYFGKTEAKKKNQTTTYKVERTDLTQTVSATGSVKAQEAVDLKFQSSGLLSWVGVKEGDYVKKWQALASLDKRELQKNLDKYLRDYTSERNDFEEAKQVTYMGHTPADALTDTVKRVLEKNQYDLEKAVLDVELKDLAIKLATLVTPIEGLVTHIDTPIAGVNITPATAVFTVVNPDTMIFEAEIDEIDIGKISSGLKAKIHLDAYPDQAIDSQISQIYFDAVATKGGGTAFLVRASLPENQDRRFKNGMNGDMEIVIDEQKEVLVIPNQAIHYRGKSPYVNKLVEGKAQKQDIEIGLETDNQTAVIHGLDENDIIILDNK